MRLKKTTKRGHGTMHELNITPLLDLVFVLLVIFHYHHAADDEQPGNDIAFEQAAAAEQGEAQDQQDQRAASGQITLNEQNVTPTELKASLQAMKATDPDLKVVVKGADEADYQNMVAVLDVLQQLDITKVGLATE